MVINSIIEELGDILYRLDIDIYDTTGIGVIEILEEIIKDKVEEKFKEIKKQKRKNDIRTI